MIESHSDLLFNPAFQLSPPELWRESQIMRTERGYTELAKVARGKEGPIFQPDAATRRSPNPDGHPPIYRKAKSTEALLRGVGQPGGLRKNSTPAPAVGSREISPPTNGAVIDMSIQKAGETTAETTAVGSSADHESSSSSSSAGSRHPAQVIPPYFMAVGVGWSCRRTKARELQQRLVRDENHPGIIRCGSGVCQRNYYSRSMLSGEYDTTSSLHIETWSTQEGKKWRQD
uniref:Uncharacterized protein n=1 Tax=Coccidioides posadasii RMSCC 3488 TaxID=454284 RepID=A0A0J6FVH7_COCPO|nr:hypothetical protein CPAG_09433 [Coccidioides posadasii RMSCC 3488]